MKWTEPDRHPIDGAPSARAPCRAPRSGGREGPPEYTTRHAALYSLVPKGGLEPPRVAPHAPQTCASANSATSARRRPEYAVAASGLSISGQAGARVPPPTGAAAGRARRVSLRRAG